MVVNIVSIIIVIADKFQSYDYGSVGNYERYKQKTPINYDLEKITIPMALFYGLNDNMGRKLVYKLFRCYF